MYVRKQELSKAQVLGSEFEDLYPEIKEVAHGQEIVSVNAIWEQVHSEWRNLESDVMEEIKYLEQATLESCSTSSKGSNRSKISKQSGQSTTLTLNPRLRLINMSFRRKRQPYRSR